MGIIANIIAGLVGSAIGQALLGTWGPTIAGMAIIPSLIGAIIFLSSMEACERNSSTINTLGRIFLDCFGK
ncbi:hypothetical protein EfmAA96_15110 [Enterococcus faecium]|nr:hypothetical protein EfmAA96_15110 [Enterococcus faecium]